MRRVPPRSRPPRPAFTGMGRTRTGALAAFARINDGAGALGKLFSGATSFNFKGMGAWAKFFRRLALDEVA